MSYKLFINVFFVESGIFCTRAAPHLPFARVITTEKAATIKTSGGSLGMALPRCSTCLKSSAPKPSYASLTIFGRL